METASFSALRSWAGTRFGGTPAEGRAHLIADLDSIAFPLFVPGDRPERYGKAAGAGADAVIIDLEDAVAPGAKDAARDALVAARAAIAGAPVPVIVRINSWNSPAHARDCEALSRLPLAAVMLPKAESAESIFLVSKATGLPVIGLIESARGLSASRTIAEPAARLAFGSIDYAADLGCSHTRQALLAARSELVVASRLAGRPTRWPATGRAKLMSLGPTAFLEPASVKGLRLSPATWSMRRCCGALSRS